MRVLKSNGKICGANLSNAEKKALQIELDKYAAQYIRGMQEELDAIILWQLHTQLGFGKKRLKRFYDGFRQVVKELSDYYDASDEENIRLCQFKLKEYGIDLDEWSKEGKS